MVILFFKGDFNGVFGRPNANGVDLNRNFPDQWHVTRHNRKQQPEALAAMDWIKSLPFVLSANLHGGSLVANYPWDDLSFLTKKQIYSECPDDKVFRKLAKAYSYVSLFYLRFYLQNPRTRQWKSSYSSFLGHSDVMFVMGALKAVTFPGILGSAVMMPVMVMRMKILLYTKSSL